MYCIKGNPFSYFYLTFLWYRFGYYQNSFNYNAQTRYNLIAYIPYIFHIFGMFCFEVCNVVNELTGIWRFVISAFVCIMRV